MSHFKSTIGNRLLQYTINYSKISRITTLYNVPRCNIHNKPLYYSLRTLPSIQSNKYLTQCKHTHIPYIRTLFTTTKAQQDTVSVQQQFHNTKQQTQSHYHTPTHNNKQIGTWLFVTAGVIFCMVTLGGVTRLTRSGLSMTEWKLHDVRPPLNNDEWSIEFDKYKRTPEYLQCNRDMTLNEFKRIYLYEYSHRVLGRVIGVVFGVPLIYFIARRRINGPLGARLTGIFILGGMQGAIGWWMVKSGLADWGYQKQSGVNQTPRVSPYRLAAHLLSAFAIYVLVLKTALNLSYPVNTATTQLIPNSLKRATLAVTAIIFVTVFSGAFVAGNQAGLIYNEFPYMGNTLIPYDDIWINEISPQWRNWFENSTLVQFDHRVLAMTTLTAALSLYLYSKRFTLPYNTRLWLNTLLGVTATQVSLGIATLINHVPVSLGSAHQFTALALLSTIIAARHSMGKITQHTTDSRTAATTTTTMKPTAQIYQHNTPVRAYTTSTKQLQHNNSKRFINTLSSVNTQSFRTLHTSYTTQNNNEPKRPAPGSVRAQISGPTFAVIVFAALMLYKTMLGPTKVEQELAQSKNRTPAKKSEIQLKQE